MRRATAILCLALALAAAAVTAGAEEDAGRKAPAQPPANVVVAKAAAGLVAPTAWFVGTVRFPEVSAVAAEVEGRVDAVRVEEGDAVKAGEVLAGLDTALLSKDLAAAEAARDRAAAALELARLEETRMAALFADKAVSASERDSAHFAARELEASVRQLSAEAARLAERLARAAVRAPFAGVVLERSVDRGEWLSPGAPVAVLARSDAVEVLLAAPEKAYAFARPGTGVEVSVAGRTLRGVISARVPGGDAATRTFPVKVRLADPAGLAQGMEARVALPAAEPVQAVLAPRDAVVMAQGQSLVFVVEDGAAKAVPVEVAAYLGMQAGLRGPGLAEGAQVVVKGQERLRPGQPVNILPQ
ncbi:MAG: efflux RND transporter periplasmic adaptor subunit [Thermodesulfobacteriota bacterium]